MKPQKRFSQTALLNKDVAYSFVLFLAIADPACSHKRAPALFIQSVYHNCSLKSYYCKDGWRAFEHRECRTLNSSYIGEMGYHSVYASGRGNQYLHTTGNPPYSSNKTELESQLHKDAGVEIMPGKDGEAGFLS
ncbi:hypothetical protein HPB48_024935 [Haemaphysalis longicornis]|uniref:Lipase domain-containing protein n=1 Tax=Haemaphysalis longicornis TaxID=44386 RepID=A0A9J6H6Q9_HAELO|nr:hypothetical protein HPB48_024935 [Haemaphysalis longicornis]